MRYKVEYQLRWLLIIGLIGILYLSNLIYIKLPFIAFHFLKKDIDHGLLNFLLSFFPEIHIEFYTYNIQTLLVWCYGILVGSKAALVTVSFYILLGLLGLPLFSSGGGIDYYKEPTFGYLISFPLLAYSSGYLYKRNKKFLGIFLPIFLTHLFGILYLFFFKQNSLYISWYLSFSMISYDLIFALLLRPALPIISFFINEIFIQEVPVRIRQE